MKYQWTLAIDVRYEMDEIVRQYSDGVVTGVNSNIIIELYITNPNVPCLDLIDMPGLVQNSSDNEPENIQALTKDIASKYIAMYQDSSIYLGVIPAGSSLRSDIAFGLIKSKNLQSKTLGVITKCDYIAAGPRRKKTLDSKINQSGPENIGLNIPNGFVCLMSEPIEDENISNFAKLRMQFENEIDLFHHESTTHLVTDKRACLSSLVYHLNSMYLTYLQEAWVPCTIKQLSEELAKLESRNRDLGLPEADTS